MLKHEHQELCYSCEQCSNTEFYDANLAWNNIAHFISMNEDLDVEFQYTFSQHEHEMAANYSLQIPNTIDYLQEKIFYEDKAVTTVAISDDGVINESYLLVFDKENVSEVDECECQNEELLKILNANLLTYIKKNGCLGIHDSRKQDFTLAQVQFFLEYKNLKDFDFYYWDDIYSYHEGEWSIENALLFLLNNRTEKSLKRELNINYIKQREELNIFYTNFISAFVSKPRS